MQESQFISSHRFTFKGQTLNLLPQKAIYWVEQKALLVADLHLGKASHFRKEGIAIPEGVFYTDLQKLDTVLNHFQVDKLLILGDLFHSRHNIEWEVFSNWLKQYKDLEAILIKGNHDILKADKYTDAGLTLVEKELIIPPFRLIHDLEDVENFEDYYPISGHLHPGVRLIKKGIPSVTLACFYFGKQFAYLPAFGRFTGFKRIKPKKNDDVFGIAGEKVICLTD